MKTSVRLLRLIALLQSRRYWSGQALSEHLDVDTRTVRRDVDRLRELGYPVQASSGVGGGYQLGAGADLPPMLLDDDEAVALSVALRSAAASVAGIEDTAIRLLAKLDQLLPARLRQRASALHAVTVPLDGSCPLPDADILTRLAAACRDQQGLRFAYRRHDGEDSLRDVEPCRLVVTGRRWYLVAWDRTREDWRTFRVDRIAAPIATGEGFRPRKPPDDPARLVARAISYAPFNFQIQLRLRASAQALSGRIPSWCGVLEAVDEHSCILNTGADSIEGLVAQIAMLDTEFEVIDNEAMRQQLAARLERMQRSLA